MKERIPSPAEIDHRLIQQLVELDGDASAAANSTVKALKSELETLASEFAQPAPENPYESESACRRANELVRAMGLDPSLDTGSGSGGATDELPEFRDLGQYRLQKLLGRGGMGAVYKALHTKLNKVVALKVLPADRLKDPGAVQRFEREMQAVGQLDHPNIVRAMDAGEINSSGAGGFAESGETSP